MKTKAQARRERVLHLLRNAATEHELHAAVAESEWYALTPDIDCPQEAIPTPSDIAIWLPNNMTGRTLAAMAKAYNATHELLRLNHDAGDNLHFHFNAPRYGFSVTRRADGDDEVDYNIDTVDLMTLHKLWLDADRDIAHPVALLVKAWQAANPTQSTRSRGRGNRVMANLLQTDRDVLTGLDDPRAGAMKAHHFIEQVGGDNTQIAIPGFAPDYKEHPPHYAAEWLQSGEQNPMKQGPAAPLPYRAINEALLLVDPRWGARPQVIRLPLNCLYGDGYRFDHKREQLAETMHLINSLPPLHTPDGIVAPFLVNEIVKRGRGEDYLDMIVTLPKGTGAGVDVWHWETMRQYQLTSGSKYMMLCSIFFYLHNPGRNKAPPAIKKGEAKRTAKGKAWRYLKEPERWPRLLTADGNPIGKRKGKAARLITYLRYPHQTFTEQHCKRALTTLHELAEGDHVRIEDGRLLPPFVSLKKPKPQP